MEPFSVFFLCKKQSPNISEIFRMDLGFFLFLPVFLPSFSSFVFFLRFLPLFSSASCRSSCKICNLHQSSSPMNISNMGASPLSTNASQLQRCPRLSNACATFAMLQGQDDGAAGVLHLQHPQHGNHFTQRTAGQLKQEGKLQQSERKWFPSKVSKFLEARVVRSSSRPFTSISCQDDWVSIPDLCHLR